MFIAWEDAGLEDHVMEWGDWILQLHMEEVTGIFDRDIMLCDVWEYTELKLNFDGRHGEYTAMDGTIYTISESIRCIDAL